MDFPKLIKILMMSTSTNEGEVVNSMLAANALLKKHCLTWLDIFGPHGFTEPPRSKTADPKPDDGVDWADKIDAMLARKRYAPKWVALLTSIRDFYLVQGRLSEKQQALVRKFAGEPE